MAFQYGPALIPLTAAGADNSDSAIVTRIALNAGIPRAVIAYMINIVDYGLDRLELRTSIDLCEIYAEVVMRMRAALPSETRGEYLKARSDNVVAALASLGESDYVRNQLYPVLLDLMMRAGFRVGHIYPVYLSIIGERRDVMPHHDVMMGEIMTLVMCVPLVPEQLHRVGVRTMHALLMNATTPGTAEVAGSHPPVRIHDDVVIAAIDWFTCNVNATDRERIAFTLPSKITTARQFARLAHAVMSEDCRTVLCYLMITKFPSAALQILADMDAHSSTYIVSYLINFKPLPQFVDHVITMMHKFKRRKVGAIAMRLPLFMRHKMSTNVLVRLIKRNIDVMTECAVLDSLLMLARSPDHRGDRLVNYVLFLHTTFRKSPSNMAALMKIAREFIPVSLVRRQLTQYVKAVGWNSAHQLAHPIIAQRERSLASHKRKRKLGKRVEPAPSVIGMATPVVKSLVELQMPARVSDAQLQAAWPAQPPVEVMDLTGEILPAPTG